MRIPRPALWWMGLCCWSLALCGWSEEAAEPPGMDKRVSFEFAETPVSEALAFLQSLLKVNVIIDPKALKGATEPITLKAQDLTVRDAFKEIARQSKLEMVWKDQALLFRLPEKPEPAAPAPAPLPELDAAQRDALKGALGKLGAEDFADREAGLETIKKLGAGTLPHLREAHKASLDAEVRARLEHLIEELDPQAVNGRIPAAVRRKLQRKVSFEFVDTPLEDAGAFVGNLIQVGVVVDREIKDSPICLRVTDMSLDLALEWICKLAEAKLTFTNGSLLITKK
ncbi:MAG: hypothetical protein AMXMBFR7_04980 [Planctomycetota bacterium]